MPLGGLPAPTSSEHPITYYRTTASAVLALGRAARYAAWLAVEKTVPTRSDPDDIVRTRATARELIAASPDSGWLPPESIDELLGGYGITLLGGAASPGTEVALGLVRDPALGPLVMVAAGGVATDVWDDRAFLIPPVSRTDAARAIRSLRLWPLLDAFRGSAPGDVAGLERMLEALGRLAVDVPEVAQLDLNPVLVGPEGCVVVDAKLRLATPAGPDASTPRQLRPIGF